MSVHVVTDTRILTARSLRHILRSPDTIITTAIMPIAFLLMFVYVFGGAIDVGESSYIDYLLPGILLITVASGVAYTAYRLFMDMQGGIVERFQSMPIARSSILWAHVLTSVVANGASLVIVVAVALVMGFRSPAHAGQWLAVAGILLLFTLAAHLGRRHRGVAGQERRRGECIQLPVDLPALHQFGVRADRHHARTGALVRGKSARDLDRECDARPAVGAGARVRSVGRIGLVRRDPPGGAGRGRGGVPTARVSGSGRGSVLTSRLTDICRI